MTCSGCVGIRVQGLGCGRWVMDNGRMSLMPPPHLVVVYLSMCAACMHVCTYVCMYVCVDIHVCMYMYACTYMHVHVCMYVCVCVCVCVCIYIYI